MFQSDHVMPLPIREYGSFRRSEECPSSNCHIRHCNFSHTVRLKSVGPASQLQEEQRPLVTDTSSINAQLGDLEGGGEGTTEDQVRKRKDQDTFHK